MPLFLLRPSGPHGMQQNGFEMGDASFRNKTTQVCTGNTTLDDYCKSTSKGHHAHVANIVQLAGRESIAIAISSFGKANIDHLLH